MSINKKGYFLFTKKKGKIIPNGVSLEKHESETVVFFTDLGYDIELIPPSNNPKTKTPDFLMNGVEWEMKSPHGKSKNTLEHIFKRAKRQSENIIIDLTHAKIAEDIAVKEIKRRFAQSKSCKRLKIITKDHRLLEFKK